MNVGVTFLSVEPYDVSVSRVRMRLTTEREEQIEFTTFLPVAHQSLPTLQGDACVKLGEWLQKFGGALRTQADLHQRQTGGVSSPPARDD
jgi:hypothetical protein